MTRGAAALDALGAQMQRAEGTMDEDLMVARQKLKPPLSLDTVSAIGTLERWSGAKVAESTCTEIRRTAGYRGFQSHLPPRIRFNRAQNR